MAMQTIFEMLPFELFRFRVLVERGGAIISATCLETGSVATADDQDTVIEIMTELLRDEWEFNIQQTGGLRNLFSSPARPSVWAVWQSRDIAPVAKDGIEWKRLPEDQIDPMAAQECTKP